MPTKRCLPGIVGTAALEVYLTQDGGGPPLYCGRRLMTLTAPLNKTSASGGSKAAQISTAASSALALTFESEIRSAVLTAFLID